MYNVIQHKTVNFLGQEYVDLGQSILRNGVRLSIKPLALPVAL